MGRHWSILNLTSGGNMNMEEWKKIVIGHGDELPPGEPLMPSGEPRLSRKKWPKNSSSIAVEIVYEGVVFIVAKARILLGKNETRVLCQAEGISRLSPLDDPEHNDPIQGREKAISQAIKALHTRVMRHRRSYHHYRG